MSFAELGLEPGLLKAVHDLGYLDPTPSKNRRSRSLSPDATYLVVLRPAPARRRPSSYPPSS